MADDDKKIIKEQEEIEKIEILKGQIEDDDTLYGTGEIGKTLGVSRDLVRITVNEFKDFFSPVFTKTGKGGHMRLTAKDVELLKTIFYLKKTKKVPEIKALLSDENVKMLIVNGSETEQLFATLLVENNKYLLNAITKEFHKIQQLEEKQLEKNLLKELLEEEKKKNEQLEKKIYNLTESFAEQEKMLQELLERTEIKKKKGIFDIFKKNNI